MIAKNINNEEFKNAIRTGFECDNEIYPLYCPHVKVSCTEDIVSDIFNRVKADIRDITVKGVYEKEQLIGYYVCDEKTLVSFALNKQYRKRKYLHAFWDLIRKDLRGIFECYLWSANKRAIKWLLKNGFNIKQVDHYITHLIYEKNRIQQW